MFLLYKLSKYDRNLFIRVVDEDGEILLIESAPFLEKWAQDPEKTENRVFISNGEVHLVSPKVLPCQDSCDGSEESVIQSAIAYIGEHAAKTRCNNGVQNCIKRRVEAYPTRIVEWTHRAHCHVPLKVASILHHNPRLISHAVRAFFYRSPDDIPIMQEMKHFCPTKCITVPVRFTRCLYAQLTSQQYSPDAKTGWQLPFSSDPSYAICLNGIKVSVGFELLLCNYLQKFAKSTNDELVNIENKYWEKFLSNLSQSGYFGGEIAGSQAYCAKLDKCKLFFEQAVRQSDDKCSSDSVGRTIYELYKNEAIDESDLKKYSLEPPDDESWLHIGPVELDKLLEDKFNSSAGNCSQDYSKSIPETVSKFVRNEHSGLKGAEKPNNVVKRFVGDKVDKIDLNKEEFSKFMEEINFLVENKQNNVAEIFDDEYDDDSSEMEDYENEDEIPETLGTELPEIKAYMKQMECELSQTMLSKSFAKCEELDSDDSECEEELKEKDIEFNALANILESYQAELDCPTAGPSTTLFAAMGQRLPDPTKNYQE